MSTISHSTHYLLDSIYKGYTTREAIQRLFEGRAFPYETIRAARKQGLIESNLKKEVQTYNLTEEGLRRVKKFSIPGE